MAISITWWLPMNFPTQLIQLRKQRSLTQQQMADEVGIHVNQIKRYEAGTTQPTLDALVKITKSLHISMDNLVFGENEREPIDDLKLQFEALSQFDDEDRKVAKAVLESLILKHNAKRAFVQG